MKFKSISIFLLLAGGIATAQNREDLQKIGLELRAGNSAIVCVDAKQSYDAQYRLNAKLSTPSLFTWVQTEDGKTSQRIEIRQPYKVSAPSMLHPAEGETYRICVTVTKE